MDKSTDFGGSMRNLKFSDISKYKKKLLVPGIQVIILFSALIFWLANRGSSFQKTFTLDELNISKNAVVTENIVTDSSLSDAGNILTTPPLSLKAGTYQILIDYNVNQPGSYVSAYSSQLGPMELRCSSANLDPDCQTATLTAELSRSTTDLQLNVYFSGTGSIRISNIIVAETSNLYKKTLFYAILFCLFISFMAYFYRSDLSNRKVIFALSVIFIAICYPLYTDYLTVGHDLPFHLLRIEGIAEGLRTGTAFPVKIHPVWAKDYGYAVGVFYGDILLYFPAVLRLLGFSVQTAYKFFVAAVNLGTVVISYYSFQRMFHSRKIGILGSLFYSASLYRLLDTYTRASVGEYCAMMFLPLVLCGFYLILLEADSKNWYKYAIVTALGLTGLVQNHVLSCEMAVPVVLLTCLFSARLVFRRYTFSALVAAFVLTVLLNIGFLLPFLDFYGSELYITSDQWVGSTVGLFQENGIFPIQLFSLFQHSNGGAWNTQAGIASEISIGVGILFLLGILLFVYLVLFHFRQCKTAGNFQPAVLSLSLGCLLMFMSTCLFPWNAMAAWGDTAKTIIYNFEFPWRFLTFATLFLTFTTCFAISTMFKAFKHETSSFVLVAMLVLFAVNCGWYFYNFSYSNTPYRVYSASDLDSMSMYSCDYLPVEVDPALITANRIIPNNMDVPDAYQKDGTRIICHAVTDTEAYTDFPINYYKYYVCTDLSTGESLPVSSGYNGMLRVTFPAKYDGTIQIAFKEPWFWRMAEGISLIAFIGCCTLLLPKKCGDNRSKVH